MVPDTENPQEAKSVYPGKPARHAQADMGQYFTQIHNVGFLAGRLISGSSRLSMVNCDYFRYPATDASD